MSNWSDPEFVREYRRKYYAENRDDLVLYQRQYYEANREKLLKYRRAYYQTNRR